MSTTTATTRDVSEALAVSLADVEGLRVSWYVADTARPPVAIIGQPTIDYSDQASGFCAASWDYPVTIVVSRNNDREAQDALSRFVNDVALALDEAVPTSPVQLIAPLEARPITVNVAGQDVPAYELRVLVRA